MDAYDKYDHELCGTEKPLPVVSDGPRLVMVFSSGELQGRGFKVEFHTKKGQQFIKNVYTYRDDTPLKQNIRFQALQHPTALAVSLIEVIQRRKANLTHHAILPTTHPTLIVHLSSLPRPTSRLQ